MEKVTHAKVKFIVDDFKTTIPITDIIEFQDAPPKNKNDFKKDYVYTCWYSDNLNPELASYGIQIGRLCESSTETVRPVFLPLHDSIKERYNKQQSNIAHPESEVSDEEVKSDGQDEQESDGADDEDNEEDELKSKRIIKENKRKLAAKMKIEQEKILKVRMEKLEGSKTLNFNNVRGNIEEKISMTSIDSDRKIVSLEKELNQYKMKYDNLKQKFDMQQARIETLQALNEKLQMQLLMPNHLNKDKSIKLTKENKDNLSPILDPIDDPVPVMPYCSTPKSTRLSGPAPSNETTLPAYADIDAVFDQVDDEVLTGNFIKDTANKHERNEKPENEEKQKEDAKNKVMTTQENQDEQDEKQINKSEEKQGEENKEKDIRKEKEQNGDKREHEYETPKSARNKKKSRKRSESSSDDCPDNKQRRRIIITEKQKKKIRSLSSDSDNNSDKTTESDLKKKYKKKKRTTDDASYTENESDCDASKKDKGHYERDDADSCSSKTKFKTQDKKDTGKSGRKFGEKFIDPATKEKMMYIKHDICVSRDDFSNCMQKKTESLFSKAMLCSFYSREELTNRCIKKDSNVRTPNGKHRRTVVSPLKADAFERALRYYIYKNGTTRDSEINQRVKKMNHYFTEEINKSIQDARKDARKN